MMDADSQAVPPISPMPPVLQPTHHLLKRVAFFSCVVVLILAVLGTAFVFRNDIANMFSHTQSKAPGISGSASFLFLNPVTLSKNNVVYGYTLANLASSTLIRVNLPPTKGKTDVIVAGASPYYHDTYAFVYQEDAIATGTPTRSRIVRMSGLTYGSTTSSTVIAESAPCNVLIAPVLNASGSMLAYASIVFKGTPGMATTVIVPTKGKKQEIADELPVAFSLDSTALLMLTKQGLVIHQIDSGAEMPVVLPSDISLGSGVQIGAVSPLSSHLSVITPSSVRVLSLDWATGAVTQLYSVPAPDTQTTTFDGANNLLAVSKSGIATSYDITGKLTGTATLHVPKAFSLLKWVTPDSSTTKKP